MTWRVLIADADPRVCAGLAELCAAAGHDARVAANAAELARERERGADLVFVALDWFAGAPRAHTVVLVPESKLGAGVDALRRGASDLLEKPFSRERVEAVLERARRAAREPIDDPASLRGHSPAMRRLLEQIERIARTPSTTVLLRGAFGVELEDVARAIHSRSARARAPFVVCRATADANVDLESALFGGREAGHEGLVAAAQGGTLFLDDVERASLAVQARILRLLGERTRRAADGSERPVDVRLVLASGGKLDEAVARGAFREDLFYRVNVLSLTVPALAERGDDVVRLARELLRDAASACGRSFRGFSADAELALRRHRWPGNVRELANVVERAALFARGDEVGVEDLALQLDLGTTPAGEFLPLGDRSLRGVEARLIRRVLAEVGGNKRRAAEVLGINRATLYNKLATLELDG
ncbi:MAG: sigma-54 dependent transcriptional regulator [Planctomycetes bacterium]|nr:sigma-54 dependent transcriptional regulator [Planctomycetota bacterium]